MTTKLRITLFALIMLSVTGYGMNEEANQNPFCHNAVEEIITQIHDTIEAAKHNLIESSTLIREAVYHFKRYRVFGEYEYLFRPEDYEKNISKLVLTSCAHSISEYAQDLSGLRDSSYPHKKSIDEVENHINYAQQLLLKDQTQIEAVLTNVIRKVLGILLSEFASTYNTLDRLKNKIVLQENMYATPATRYKLALQLCKTPLNCNAAPGLVCPSIPVLRSVLDPVSQKPLYLSLPPIMHQKVIHDEIFTGMVLEVLRLLNKLSAPKLGLMNTQTSLIPTKFTIFNDSVGDRTFDTTIWHDYLNAPEQPELTSDLLEPEGLFVEDDFYALVVETQRQGWFELLFNMKECNECNAPHKAIHIKPKRSKPKHVVAQAENRLPEDPEAFAQILAQFPEEEDVISPLKSVIKKKKKHPAAEPAFKPLSIQSSKQANRKARKDKELEAAIAEVAAMANESNDNDVKEAAPQKKPAKTNRADRDTSHKQPKSKKLQERHDRGNYVNTYIERFDNFDDLHPLRPDVQLFFESLYSPKTRLINYDALIKFSLLAGITIQNRSGSIRIFSWQDPVTGLKMVKRFDEPHLKNNNERKYSSYTIGILREFFSALRPTCPQRILHTSSQADQKFFRSNILRFIQK